MNIDINEILADMTSVIKKTVAEDWSEVKTVSIEFLKRRKERLELLADMRINGEINQQRFESRINDEKLILEAELHAITVISKAIAQKTANAAIDVLTKAVKIAISGVL